MDPQGKRTIFVLTKVDMAEENLASPDRVSLCWMMRDFIYSLSHHSHKIVCISDKEGTGRTFVPHESTRVFCCGYRERESQWHHRGDPFIWRKVFQELSALPVHFSSPWMSMSEVYTLWKHDIWIQAWTGEFDSTDNPEPELCSIRMFLEDGAGHGGTAGWCLQGHSLQLGNRMEK